MQNSGAADSTSPSSTRLNSKNIVLLNELEFLPKLLPSRPIDDSREFSILVNQEPRTFKIGQVFVFKKLADAALYGVLKDFDEKTNIATLKLRTITPIVHYEHEDDYHVNIDNIYSLGLEYDGIKPKIGQVVKKEFRVRYYFGCDNNVAFLIDASNGYVSLSDFRQFFNYFDLFEIVDYDNRPCVYAGRNLIFLDTGHVHKIEDSKLCNQWSPRCKAASIDFLWDYFKNNFYSDQVTNTDKIKLYEYQKICASKLIMLIHYRKILLIKFITDNHETENKKMYLKLHVGAGKSFIVVEMINRLLNDKNNRASYFIVCKHALKPQWKNDYSKYFAQPMIEKIDSSNIQDRRVFLITEDQFLKNFKILENRRIYDNIYDVYFFDDCRKLKNLPYNAIIVSANKTTGQDGFNTITVSRKECEAENKFVPCPQIMNTILFVQNLTEFIDNNPLLLSIYSNLSHKFVFSCTQLQQLNIPGQVGAVFDKLKNTLNTQVLRLLEHNRGNAMSSLHLNYITRISSVKCSTVFPKECTESDQICEMPCCKKVLCSKCIEYAPCCSRSVRDQYLLNKYDSLFLKSIQQDLANGLNKILIFTYNVNNIKLAIKGVSLPADVKILSLKGHSSSIDRDITTYNDKTSRALMLCDSTRNVAGQNFQCTDKIYFIYPIRDLQQFNQSVGRVIRQGRDSSKPLFITHMTPTLLSNLIDNKKKENENDFVEGELDQMPYYEHVDNATLADNDVSEVSEPGENMTNVVDASNQTFKKFKTQ